MGQSIVQNSDGSAGLRGPGGGAGEMVIVNFPYTASSVDQTIFTASRKYIVKAIMGRVDVAGSDGSAVTATIRKAASGTALTSGTALHSGTFNLKGTAATNQTLTLSTTASDLIIAAGDSIVCDFTGTLTAAVGTISVHLCPA